MQLRSTSNSKKATDKKLPIKEKSNEKKKERGANTTIARKTSNVGSNKTDKKLPKKDKNKSGDKSK